MHSIQDVLRASIEVKQRILENKDFLEKFNSIVDALVRVFENKNKLWLCGNGGSAADAQHLSAEFTGRFYYNRPPLPAEALHVNTSYMTAVANDFGYDEVYARLLEGMAQKGDMLWAFSTSGNSPNIIKACKKAHEMGISVVGFTGESGGEIKNLCDFLLNIPSLDTPRIQECHITLGHGICEQVEAMLFPKK